MNSCDERIEELLNRAGQTISDLPKPSVVYYAYPKDLRRYIPDVAATWHGRLNYGSCDLEDYILHLTDIIDRLETALENVCGERDYLEKRLADVYCDCHICVYADVNWAEMPCYQCDIPPAEKHFEFAGIPEDWRGDDN